MAKSKLSYNHNSILLIKVFVNYDHCTQYTSRCFRCGSKMHKTQEFDSIMREKTIGRKMTNTMM